MEFAPTYKLPLNDAGAYEESQRMIAEMRDQFEATLKDHVMIQLGELQVTPRAIASSAPEVVLKYVAHHQCGTDLTDDEKDMRTVTRELHAGRYVSAWPVLPIVLTTPEGWQFWNKHFENMSLAIITLADESVTVVCMADEVPRVGCPGHGAGTAPELTSDVNAEIVEHSRKGLL